MTRPIPFGSADAPPFPSKIVAVGKNYREHAAEFGSVAPEDEPMLFLKAPSSIVFGEGDIVLPPESERVEYESNIFQVPSGSQDDVIFKTIPGVLV